MKKHNFYAGPSILSEYTKQQTAEACLDFAGTGLSVMEVSHRSSEFIDVMNKARQLFVELLDIPTGYDVVLVGGGASTQFTMVPYNLLNKKAAYIETGSWSSKAIKEAKMFGEVEVIASSKESNHTFIPKDFVVPTDADYLHITSNNTIYGTQYKVDPDVNVPLVADMSSDIFSRPIDFSKYSIVYGGAQKNLAPSGLTFAIVKEDALGKVDRPIPTMLNYKTHIEKESMFNTPPCLPVFAALKTLEYYKELGGLPAIMKLNDAKSNLLYDEINRNKLFVCPVVEEDRSNMNVTFVMNEAYKEIEKDFLALATSKGIVGIKGHRSVGGFRASIYNAMQIESVQVLVDAMKEFETKL